MKQKKSIDPRPKCRTCKERFVPFNNNLDQKHCMQKDECIAGHVVHAKSIQQKRQQKEKRIERIRKENTRHSLKGKQDYEKELEKVVNEFIRLRDIGKPCISCERPYGEYTVSAGHYFPAGSFKNIRFDVDNIHGQCWYNCNKNKHGNLAQYLPNLIKKIGQERFDLLEARSKIPAHFTIPELVEMKIKFKEMVKELKISINSSCETNKNDVCQKS